MLDQNRRRIPCTIMRGGTSKGVYILENYLPKEEKERNDLLLKIMGSPDLKQINGLGGAASVTSKVAVVGVSSRPDADVDYTFAQVAVDKPVVSYKGNCGNISSGVGPVSYTHLAADGRDRAFHHSGHGGRKSQWKAAGHRHQQGLPCQPHDPGHQSKGIHDKAGAHGLCR